MVDQNMVQKIGINKLKLKEVKKKLLKKNNNFFFQNNNLYYYYKTNKYNYKYYRLKAPLNLDLYQLINLITKMKLNLNISNVFKFFLFLIKTDSFFAFKKDFKKFKRVFQRKGKLRLSTNNLYSISILNKKYFKLENFLYFYLILHLFKTPLRINLKKKGFKTLVIPQTFSLNSLLNVSITLFYKSVFKNTNSNYRTFVSKGSYELFLVLSKDHNNSKIGEYYKSLFENFIKNRSWLNFK